MLFIHDPFREEKFVAGGCGVDRRPVNNHFVIGSRLFYPDAVPSVTASDK